jgi:co-chaperonin GroES (HSP10)
VASSIGLQYFVKYNLFTSCTALIGQMWRRSVQQHLANHHMLHSLPIFYTYFMQGFQHFFTFAISIIKNCAMHLTSDNRLKKLIVIGDRLLIKPSKPDERTASGLYLPPGVQEKEKVQQGYVIKTGPGYAIPMPVEDESWKGEEEQVKYVPLQAKEGDLAIFLVSGATEVMYENEKYFIVPQGAVLMLEREEDL